MSRKYTAQEIRDAVQKSICEDNIAEMLLQYADELDREKKFEYAERFALSGRIDHIHYDGKNDIEREREMSSVVVRREVGEWEEVK